MGEGPARPVTGPAPIPRRTPELPKVFWRFPFDPASSTRFPLSCAHKAAGCRVVTWSDTFIYYSFQLGTMGAWLPGILHAVAASLQQEELVSPHADGCARVYVDVGTNIGVQLRKLYEPHLFPGAPVLPIFDRYFGADREKDRSLCAYGFEANPSLSRRLRALERAYRARGCRIHIFTETAAGTRDGIAPFDFWANASDSFGSRVPIAGIRGRQRATRTMVREVDLARFLAEVHARKLPAEGGRPLDLLPSRSARWPGSSPAGEALGTTASPTDRAASPSPGVQPAVVVKLDIEGAEYKVVPHLLERDVLCNLSMAFVEFHPHFFKHEKVARRRAVRWGQKINHLRLRGCSVRSVRLDDETYAGDNGVMVFSRWDKTRTWGQVNSTPLPVTA